MKPAAPTRFASQLLLFWTVLGLSQATPSCKAQRARVQEAVAAQAPLCLLDQANPQICYKLLASTLAALDADIQTDVDAATITAARAQLGILPALGAPARDGGALALDDPSQPFAEAAVNTKTADRLSAFLAFKVKSSDRLSLAIVGSEPGMPTEAELTPFGNDLKHPVYHGLATAGGPHDPRIPVFVKPFAEDAQTSLKDINNGYLDAQITQHLRSLNLPGLLFPETRVVTIDKDLRCSVRSEQTTRRALMIAAASADGRRLSDFESFFVYAREGQPRPALSLSPYLTGNSGGAYQVSEATAAALTDALQRDALLRYVVGDFDGHLGQYLVQYALDDRQVASAVLVSLDRGAAASDLLNSTTSYNRDDYEHRRFLVEDGLSYVDLGWQFSLPSAKTLSADFIQALRRFRYLLQDITVDPTGANPVYDKLFRRTIEGRFRYIERLYAIQLPPLADSANDHRDADSPDASDQQDDTRKDAGSAVDPSRDGRGAR